MTEAKKPKRCKPCQNINSSKSRGDWERNKKLIELAKTGEHTLQQIGDKYGITRERVRQIILKKGGTINLYREKNRVERIEEIMRLGEEIKFYCKACERPVKYKFSFGLHDLCLICSYIRNVAQRNPFIFRTCRTCGNLFHPFSNTTSMGRKGEYCHNRCWLKRMFERKAIIRKYRRKEV